MQAAPPSIVEQVDPMLPIGAVQFDPEQQRLGSGAVCGVHARPGAHAPVESQRHPCVPTMHVDVTPTPTKTLLVEPPLVDPEVLPLMMMIEPSGEVPPGPFEPLPLNLESPACVPQADRATEAATGTPRTAQTIGAVIRMNMRILLLPHSGLAQRFFGADAKIQSESVLGAANATRK
jgi:hypothetical protein